VLIINSVTHYEFNNRIAVMNDFDDPRRQFLVKALTAGMYAVGSMGILQPVNAMGKIPKELVAGKSIYDMGGEVRVNGQAANLQTIIGPNDTVETDNSSFVVFAVGKDAFVLRSNGKLKMKGGSSIISSISLIGGKLLSVFGKRPEKQKMSIRTVSATIGIRGTGIYVESEPQGTYVCTCYGVVDIASVNDKKSRKIVTAQHHDTPVFVLPDRPAGQKIQHAPMFNHTDDELALLEALVGRSVPFSSIGGYGSPRKPGY
jgi:hypothetical protein